MAVQFIYSTVEYTCIEQFLIGQGSTDSGQIIWPRIAIEVEGLGRKSTHASSGLFSPRVPCIVCDTSLQNFGKRVLEECNLPCWMVGRTGLHLVG